MDEILIDRYVTDPVLVAMCKKIVPDHIEEGSLYPAVAYTLSGDIDPCAKGLGNFKHSLMFVIEAKTKREVIDLKNRIVVRFNRWNYLSLLGYEDTFEPTTKTYIGLLNFKITKTVI